MDQQLYFCCLILLIFSKISFAGILDRSGQSVDILSTEGHAISYEHLRVRPDVTGTDSLGQSAGSVSQPFTLQQLNIKTVLNNNLSLAFIVDQPWGGDFVYSDSTVLFGGTVAKLESQALTGLLQTSIGERASLFAGLRLQEIKGELALGGLAFGPLAGYSLTSEKDRATGYVAGASYDLKGYALRLSVVYNSEVKHTLDTNENISPVATNTRIVTPQSVNINFRTGIAPKTLFFTSLRWVDWSRFTFDSDALAFDIINFDDDLFSYTLGFARQISPKWVSNLTVLHEPGMSSSNSLFTPSNGYTGLALGLTYQTNEHWRVSGRYSIIQVGDSSAETAGGNSVRFRDNTSEAFNIYIKYAF